MNKPFELQLRRVAGTKLAAPGGEPWHVARSDPAQSVMSDFHERSAVTVAERTPLDNALDHMKHCGVRSAFVVGDDGDHVLGVVTAYDIQGEKPLRHLQELGGTHRTSSRRELAVRDIMTPVTQWQVLDMKEVARATIGHVVDAFRLAGGTHMAVVEISEAQEMRLRGVFSIAKILRLLHD